MKKRFIKTCRTVIVMVLTVFFMAVSASAMTIHTPGERWIISETFVMPEPVEEPVIQTSSASCEDVAGASLTIEAPLMETPHEMQPSLDDDIDIIDEADEEEPPAPILELTQREIDLIASVVKIEDGHGEFEGQVGVAKVIINRVLSDAFPDTVETVLNQKGQFDSVPAAYYVKADDIQYEAVEAALYDTTIPDGVVFFARNPENSHIYGKLGSHWFCYGYNWN